MLVQFRHIHNEYIWILINVAEWVCTNYMICFYISLRDFVWIIQQKRSGKSLVFWAVVVTILSFSTLRHQRVSPHPPQSYRVTNGTKGFKGHKTCASGRYFQTSRGCNKWNKIIYLSIQIQLFKKCQDTISTMYKYAVQKLKSTSFMIFHLFFKFSW